MRSATLTLVATGILAIGLAGCASDGPTAKEAAADAAPEVTEERAHEPAACSCEAGKAGETTWCADCEKGYVDGKATDCKDCYQAKQGGAACEACAKKDG
jgi:hypothetical protein